MPSLRLAAHVEDTSIRPWRDRTVSVAHAVCGRRGSTKGYASGQAPQRASMGHMEQDGTTWGNGAGHKIKRLHVFTREKHEIRSYAMLNLAFVVN